MTLIDLSPFSATQGESRMLLHLIPWLERRRWIREDTEIRFELPVNSRRVDLVTWTASGKLAAFELKLGGFSRVLEQAAYNRIAFDRSWIVTGARPRASNLQQAATFGIGVIVVESDTLHVAISPGVPTNDQTARARVVKRITEGRVRDV